MSGAGTRRSGLLALLVALVLPAAACANEVDVAGSRESLIVGLDVPACTPGAPDEACAEAIGAAVASLEQALAGTDYRVERTYRTIPFVALDVGPDARAVLDGSPLVTSIEANRTAAPQ